MIKFYLPFPPSVNSLYPTVDKIRIKSATYKRWIKQANLILNKQNIPILNQRCIVEYHLNHPDNRIRDAENYAKALTDFLVYRNILQGDDRRYLKATLASWNDIKGKLVEINIILI
jgi:Holliday junction resolvase RusA-like endonuclease